MGAYNRLDLLSIFRCDFCATGNGHVFLVFGREHYQQIPLYLPWLVAEMIPTKSTTTFYSSIDRGYWSTTFPTKLFEYLAAGRPVVTSALENVMPYASVVTPARTTKEWIEAIEHAIADGGTGSAAERRAVARENTWDHCVDLLEGWLEGLLRDDSVTMDEGAGNRAGTL